jgi:hypothetical protein
MLTFKRLINYELVDIIILQNHEQITKQMQNNFEFKSSFGSECAEKPFRRPPSCEPLFVYAKASSHIDALVLLGLNFQSLKGQNHEMNFCLDIKLSQ